MAALLVAMTGCQKEPQVETQENPDAVGYVTLNIKLPSTAAVRANDEYDQGNANEYKVNTVDLVFFRNGTFIEHQSVTVNSWSAAVPGNITTNGQTDVLEVSDIAINQVLVLLNAGEIFKTANDFRKDYDDLNAWITASVEDVIGTSTDAFFMSNAPFHNGTDIQYLYSITPKANKTEVTPTTVNVERSAAKVQLKWTSFTQPTNGDLVTFAKWNVDNTNKAFYPVRKCNDSWWDTDHWKYSLGTATRIYFAEDNNFNTATSDLALIASITDGDLGDNAYTYCLENTFDIDHMTEKHTTRAIVKATYMPKSPITDGSEVWDNSSAKTWFMVGAGNTAYTPNALIKAIIEKSGVTGKDTEIATKVNAATAGAQDWTDLLGDSSINVETLLGTVKCYLNGVCYYPILIRHFNDDELGYTGLNTFESAFADGMYDQNDLGRYGVVRNNWYRITINSVSRPGEPTIPTPGDSKDDKTKAYLQCDIKILAWCTRDQGVDL